MSISVYLTPIDFGAELLKGDNVFSNFLVIMHFEPFKLIFSIGFDVKGTKVGPEFGNKFAGDDGGDLRDTSSSRTS